MSEIQRVPDSNGDPEPEPAAYYPVHHAPHPPSRSDAPPLDTASPKVSRECVAAERPDGQPGNMHGDLHTGTSEQLLGLRQRAPERKATGLKAVVSSFHYAWGEAGLLRSWPPI